MLAARRLLAFAVDYLVVVLWAAVLFGGVMIVTGGQPPRPSSPWNAQALGFVTMTSAMRGSLGKRSGGRTIGGPAHAWGSFGE